MSKKIQIKLKSNIMATLDQKILVDRSWNFDQFDQLANILLNKTLFVANAKKFRLSEIEFYYCGEGHSDTYTHCSDEQQMNGKFYFHKYKTGTYKSGTYKGLDITLSPDKLAYFGILIRSIQDQETGKITEGPCKSVNMLLEQFGHTEVKDFVRDKILPLNIYDEQYQFHIIDTNQLPAQIIYKGPRIGLSDKYPQFKELPYRYAINLDQIHKQKRSMKRLD
jgi:hypothetical protein